jgi:hypothetical protein
LQADEEAVTVSSEKKKKRPRTTDKAEIQDETAKKPFFSFSKKDKPCKEKKPKQATEPLYTETPINLDKPKKQAENHETTEETAAETPNVQPVSLEKTKKPKKTPKAKTETITDNQPKTQQKEAIVSLFDDEDF